MPHSSSSSLTFSLYGRRVSPLVLGFHGTGGREPLRDWICLSVSLYFCVPDSALSRFLIFSEIHKSDWIETFNTICSRILAFLRQKKGNNRLTGCPRGSGARPLPRGPLRHRLALITLPKIHIYSKKIFVSFYSVWTPFDMDFL